MTTAAAARAISKAYTTLRNIESAADLKKERLTLAEYDAARDLFGELSTPRSSAKTFIKSVADFYSRAGFTVFEFGNHYTITTA